MAPVTTTGRVGLDRQMQEVRRLLEGRRAVRDDEAGRRIRARKKRMDALGELQPLLRPDRRAADLQHVLAGKLGELARFGNAREHLLDGQLPAQLRIQRVVEPVRADAGDAAAGAENMDSRQHHGSRITLPKKSRESTTRCASAACGERERLVDDGLQLAVGDEAHDLPQLEHRGVLRAGEAQLLAEERDDVELDHLAGVRADGDDDAAAREALQAPGEDLAADVLHDHVDAAAAGDGHHLARRSSPCRS